MPLPITAFFTAPDDDFILKGARDPLGFQAIWQQTARPLIPFLNTVCGNLRDWQILCLGHALHQFCGTAEDIVPFFLRFEQLMAHSRMRLNPELSFNGVEKTKRLANEAKKTRPLGNTPAASLLQNQRSYGIWGKYSTPFAMSGLQAMVRMQPLFTDKIAAVRADGTAAGLLKKVERREGTTVREDELEALEPLLRLTEAEAQFFRAHLLQHPLPHHPQNALYALCESGEAADPLFPLLGQLAEHAGPGLATAVEDIRQTELILCPLNRMFRVLQTQRTWSMADAAQDDYLTHCLQPALTDGLRERHAEKAILAAILAKPAPDAITEIIARNKQVAARRGGSEWMAINGNLIEVNHAEGGWRDRDRYEPETTHDNPYFLKTYLGLHYQIAGAA